MIAFIDTYRGQFGVELICRTLGATLVGWITSRGYRAAKSRAVSARSISDAQLVDTIRTLHKQNFSVYGVKKMHAVMRREGYAVGREQTRRLMRLAGVRGVHRGRRVFTTHVDPDLTKPKDLVKRNFFATQPNQLRVVDIT